MMGEKKRLAIFSFYDSEGIVDSFIEFLLKDLNEVATELVIVINGFVCHEGYQILSKYTKNIVIRDNIGFDIGAFKLGYEKYCINSRENQWDEIIFCNDTFYGPLKSFKDIFKHMEQEEGDFWGLNLVNDGMFTHLQSFFLVFRNKRIIQFALEEYFNNQTIKMLICLIILKISILDMNWVYLNILLIKDIHMQHIQIRVIMIFIKVQIFV